MAMRLEKIQDNRSKFNLSRNKNKILNNFIDCQTKDL